MPSPISNALLSVAALACACALGLCGCSEKSVKAANPAPITPAPTVADSKPITNIAPDTNATPPVANVAPPVTETPQPSSATLPVTPVHSKPAPPPKKPAPEPATETASETSKPAAPQIVPQLSAGDQATYQHQTLDDIQAAQGNLRQATGKNLSAAQQDLIQKIQDFIKESRAASQEGDWKGAQQLSQKARRVSDELIASF